MSDPASNMLFATICDTVGEASAYTLWFGTANGNSSPICLVISTPPPV